MMMKLQRHNNRENFDEIDSHSDPKIGRKKRKETKNGSINQFNLFIGVWVFSFMSYLIAILDGNESFK